MKKPAWLEKRLADHWLTVQQVSTALSRFPEGETWHQTPKLLKLRRYLNAKRALQAMEEGKAEITTLPTYLTIDPFSACNLRCPLCPTGNGTNTLRKGTLQLDVFKHIIDEIGTYLYNIDLFNWGEPLLNKDIYDMISYAHERHILTSISSNFHFFDEAAAERMISSGLDYLILSIDGATPKTYKKYRVRGKFKRVVENVRILTETRKRLGKKTPYIFWQFLVFRHNEHEIEAARELALELGVDEFKTEHAYLPVATRAEGEAWIPRNPEHTRYNLRELEAMWTAKEAEERERAAAEEAARAAREEEERAHQIAKHEQESRVASERAELERGANGGTATTVAEAVSTAAEVSKNAIPRCASGTMLELFPIINKPDPPPARPRIRLPNCSWLYITTTVNADGKVYPCCVTSEAEDFVGDVDDDGSHVTSFWNNKQYQAARLFSTRGIETGVETICHRCPIGGIAGGH